MRAGAPSNRTVPVDRSAPSSRGLRTWASDGHVPQQPGTSSRTLCNLEYVDMRWTRAVSRAGTLPHSFISCQASRLQSCVQPEPEPAAVPACPRGPRAARPAVTGETQPVGEASSCVSPSLEYALVPCAGTGASRRLSVFPVEARAVALAGTEAHVPKPPRMWAASLRCSMAWW